MTLPPIAWAALVVAGCGLVSTVWWMQASGASRATPAELAAVVAAICLVSATTVGNLLFRWLRWHFLWRRLGVVMPARNSALMFAALLPAGLSPLALGEVLVGLFLKRYSAMPWRQAWASWTFSRLADATALLLIASLDSWPAWLALVLLLGLAALAMSAELVSAGQPRSLQAGVVDCILFVSLSVCAWVLPGIGLWAASAMIATPADLVAQTALFASSTLFGALTLLPGGVVATGSAMVDGLVGQGMELRHAVHVVVATRTGTLGLSLLMGLFAWAIWHRALRDMAFGRQRAAQAHFDELSASYADEIPAHIRDRLLARKITLLRSTLAAHAIASDGPAGPARGFDLGCGHGWYAIELARYGFAMQGGDLSAGQIASATSNGRAAGLTIDWRVLDGARLPAADASLDFVYAINVLHHVTAPAVRARLLDDVIRVLRPGGVFVLHEINTRNPLFRLYMSYLFPLVRNIDDGTELWIEPDAPPAVPGASWEKVPSYFTFLPDFVPAPVMHRLMWLERRLEHSRLRVWSAHYQLVLEKNQP